MTAEKDELLKKCTAAEERAVALQAERDTLIAEKAQNVVPLRPNVSGVPHTPSAPQPNV